MTTQPQTQKPKKGCLFYGCLTIAILSLALLVGGGIGLYAVYKKAAAVVEEFTSTEPMQLPMVTYTDGDRELFEKRVNIFSTGLAEGKPTVPLVLKGQDLNMLLATSPDLKTLADGVRVTVEGDQVKGAVSLKLADIGSPFFKERYLNGEASFTVSLTDGLLQVSPNEIIVNGTSLPEEQMAQLREFNLVEGINQNPELMETLEKLKTIEVRDGAVRVVPKDAE